VRAYWLHATAGYFGPRDSDILLVGIKTADRPLFQHTPARRGNQSRSNEAPSTSIALRPGSLPLRVITQPARSRESRRSSCRTISSSLSAIPGQTGRRRSSGLRERGFRTHRRTIGRPATIDSERVCYSDDSCSPPGSLRPRKTIRTARVQCSCDGTGIAGAALWSVGIRSTISAPRSGDHE